MAYFPNIKNKGAAIILYLLHPNQNHAGAVKSVGDVQPGVLHEIRALELFTLKLQREVATEVSNELTGKFNKLFTDVSVPHMFIPRECFFRDRPKTHLLALI